jgi:AcrR family transcriptional regulator
MEHSSETEQKIINAATKVFLEKGKDGARMQEIADQAAINKALLHYYFRSKDKLFETVFKQEFKSIFKGIIPLTTTTHDFKDFLHQFITNYLQMIFPRRNLMRFILWEITKVQPNLTQYILEVFHEYGFQENPVILRIRQAIDQGEIRAIDPSHFIMSLLGMCVFPILAAPVMERILPNANFQNSDFLEQRIEAIVDVLWEGIKPE